MIIVEEKLKKFVLPSRNNLIIHTNVLEVFSFYRQRSLTDSESGGFLLGYQNLTTNSIIIDDLSVPQKKDFKNPIRFIIRDSGHKKKIQQAQKRGSFFLGTWHTHPQDFVSPSFIDISDWKESIKEEKPAADFMVFVIVGRQEFGVWVGDNEQKKIIRIREKM